MVACHRLPITHCPAPLSHPAPTIGPIMKILHTSDWHLGRNFSSVSLHEVQAEFCEWVLQTAIANGVELLVVAGDLYDRSIPPQESVALWRTTLIAFHQAGIAVVAIAGNHDGADRVSAFDGLTDEARVFVRGGYGRAGEIITLGFSDGPLDVALIPFLDPQLAPPEWKAELAEAEVKPTHESVLEKAIDRARFDSKSSRSLAVVHAFVGGSTTADSERQLTVGGTDQVAATVLEGFSYVALGHLHTPQVIGGAEQIRYSGTPIAYSFSETGPKSVVLIEMSPDGGCSAEVVPVPVGRGVITLTGTIDELLAPGAHPEAAEKYVKAVLTDNAYVVDAKSRLLEVYPYCTDVVMKMAGTSTAIGPNDEIRSALSPRDAAEKFWEDIVNEPLSELQRDTVVAAIDKVFITNEVTR
ncbi:MAG: exonuclease subunit SbcD [Actinobacteria bacterium]|nr:exonuclease subunit SbcD [Actinomycetota bacterium]